MKKDPWDDKDQLWECDNCNHICKEFDMQSDSYWADGMEDEYWCHLICPKCNSWNQPEDWTQMNK